MDKELIKKLVAQGKAYVLDLRGGSVPYKEGIAAAVDFLLPTRCSIEYALGENG